MKVFFVLVALVVGSHATCVVNHDAGSKDGLEWVVAELNTAEVQEDVPEINPKYSPLSDAVCFNQDYDPPQFSQSEMVEMIKDYQKIFEWGFHNQMGSPLQSVSVDNNSVTNNRFPSMYLRMCFHDNTVDPSYVDFQDYINENLGDNGEWNGYSKYLKTSGADASNLVCEEERLHPNNDYDKTASRVLYSMQVKDVISGGKSLKEKWGVSYADLLHNGCIAATAYLTRQAPYSIVGVNPLQFGRRDSCFIDQCSIKHELCGPSNILPGLGMSVSGVNSWFTSRGMDECLWISTLWTHTVMDNMASTCPLKLLPCNPGPQEMYEFDKGGTDEPYFFPGDNLDYFSFFLQPGKHVTSHGFMRDQEDTSCDWEVDGKRKPWPMTAIDCTLGLDNVEEAGEHDLKNAILNFHKPEYKAADILLCALNVLGGHGDMEHGICDLIAPSECKPKDGHKFGGVFESKVLKSGTGNSGGEIGVITGAFTASATVRFDDLGGGHYQRIFDFNNGPGKENVWLGQTHNSNTIALEVFQDNGVNRLEAHNALVQGETADWRVGIDETGWMWIAKNGVRIAQKFGLVPVDKPRVNQYIGKSAWSHDTPLEGETTNFYLQSNAPLPEISGPFVASMTAKFDNLDLKWQRLFDFGNGPGKDNVYLSQADNSNKLIFQIYGTGGKVTLYAYGAIVEGETAQWRVGLSLDGEMWIEKNGNKIASKWVGQIVPDVKRSKKYIGHSNWDGDAPLKGDVGNFQLINL